MGYVRKLKLYCLLISFLTSSALLQVQGHASPDLNDLVQEVIRNNLPNAGAEFVKDAGKQILTNRLLSLIKPENFPFLSQSPKTEEPSEILPKEDSSELGNDKDVDEDLDPEKYIVPLSLPTICHDITTFLTPWNPALDFGTNTKGRDFKKQCVPLSVYSSRIPAENFEDNHFCAIEGTKTSIGICCSESLLESINEEELDKTNHDIPEYRNNLASRSAKRIHIKYQSALTEGTEVAESFMKNLYKTNEKWKQEGNSVKVIIPILEQVYPETRDVGDGGLALVETTRAIALNLKGSNSGSIKRVPPASVLKTNTGKNFCTASNLPICASASKRYRTLDGSCNNLQDIAMGQVFQPLIRLTRSAYEDGIFSPRIASKSGPSSILPSPRLISTTIATGLSRPSRSLNFAFAALGQFIGHDMSHVPIYDLGADPNGSNGIACCSSEGQTIVDVENLHPLCLPIDVPKDDTFYASFGVTCIPFIRSMVSSKQCTIGAAQQLSQTTHWMDLSQVYGSLDRVSDSLREKSGGRLKVFKYSGSEHLMLNSTCNLKLMEGKCAFDTGDLRGNHQLYLTILQTMWEFEHNRVARILENYHSEWSDEQIFYESRRIVTAEYQHIVYNEFLPVLLGKSLANRFKLLPNFLGFTEYNSVIDASVSNEHTAAAFRMGHSMIANVFKVISSEKTASNIRVKDGIETPLYFLSNGINDGILRGFTRIPMENVDQWVTPELTQQLFKPPSTPYGQDLISINIQRGRDHALPGYVDVVKDLREYCELPLIESFSDMAKLMSPESVSALKGIYKHHEDVDLYIAGLLETPVNGGLLGPTFGCIIADQFSRSKFGDRFFYEHGNLLNSFDKDQLVEIRKASAARIFCDNGQDIKSMQPLAFRRISSGNPLIPCSDDIAIPEVDLSIWKNYKIR